VPGYRDVIARGLTGLLCAPLSAEALAEQFSRFLDVPQYMQAAMGKAARTRMEDRYDEQIVVRAYLDAISRVR